MYAYRDISSCGVFYSEHKNEFFVEANIMLGLTLWSLFFIAAAVKSEDGEVAKTRNKRAEVVCYGSLGCFNTSVPFVSSNWPITFLPQSPNAIKTRLLLYTNESRFIPEVLDARFPNQFAANWTQIKTRPTKILIHGFIDNIKYKPAWREMVDEVVKNGDYNVVFVDWSGGNQPPYTQATANTRVVGAQVAELVNALTESLSIKASDVHIIGHSLGAHVAGYAGERIKGLGRITGLDPAGPYFEDTDKSVRLDETDAYFVDIIHSNAQPLLQLGFGTRQISGHIDFFPNLGRHQSGCPNNPLPSLLSLNIIDALDETALCSHVRSLRFFNESINSPCPFMAYPCDSEKDFVNNRCHSCRNGGCQRMGFHATKVGSQTGQKFFLTTGGEAPYCRYHFAVVLKLAALGAAQRGQLTVNINADNFSFNQVRLNRDPQVFQPNQVYQFFLTAPRDFGNVRSVTVGWKSAPTFDLSDHKLYLQEIHVYREETGIDAAFCVGSQSIESGGQAAISSKC